MLRILGMGPDAQKNVARLVIGLIVCFGSASIIRAQAKKQKFEVVSIHTCDPKTVLPLREGGGLGIVGPSPNRVVKSCVTVMTLLPDRAAPRVTATEQPEGSGNSQFGVSLYTALEHQLGLKLVPVKGTRQELVIDHIEKPSTN